MATKKAKMKMKLVTDDGPDERMIVEQKTGRGWIDWDGYGVETWSYNVYPVVAGEHVSMNTYSTFVISDGYQSVSLDFSSTKDNPDAGVEKLVNLQQALIQFREHLENAVGTRKIINNIKRKE